jgi:hypothetical protein
MRFFGFYRPYGMRKNIYMVFKTGDTSNHYRTLSNLYYQKNAEAIEILSMMGYNSYGEVLYSKNYHMDHEKKFAELLDRLSRDGNVVDMDKANFSIKYWPYVTLSDDNHRDDNYLEKVLNE